MLTLVVAVALLLLLYLSSRKPQGYPPGPPRLPLIGYLPFLETHLSHKNLWRLSSTYGPVVGLYIGRIPKVIVNGWDAVKEALLNEDLNGRASSTFAKEVYASRRGVLFTESEFWKEQRRFTLHHFRNLGFGKRTHEAIVHEEVSDLIQEIKDIKGSVTLPGMLGVSFINILWAVMGGTRLGRNDPRLWDLVDRLNTLFRAGKISGGLVQSFPALRHFISQNSGYKVVVRGFSLVRDFIMEAVDEHKAKLDPENPRDYIDIYIKEIEKQKENANTTFTDDQLLAMCTDIFSAGTETSSATVSFGILLMVLHPEIMGKVQQELDEMVGRCRFPTLDDRKKLVYTDAVLNELFRFRSALPIAIPHKATQDTVLQGYRIPAETSILINLYSVHMDPDYWGDPETFRPERFINPDGTLRKDERLIPFGKGRRVCLGESLARMTSFIIFSSLLQNFTFTLDPAVPVPDTEGKSGFTLGPPEFRVFAEPRE